MMMSRTRRGEAEPPATSRRALLIAVAAIALDRSALTVRAATPPLDVTGTAARIAAPFAMPGFSGGLGQIYYQPSAGTVAGGLTAKQADAVADGFKAGFYLPLFDSKKNGASGKGYDAYCFFNALLFASNKQASAAAGRLLSAGKPKSSKIATKALANGLAYAAYDWSGKLSGFNATAHVHRATFTLGAAVWLIDWADFAKPLTTNDAAALIPSFGAALGESRSGVPLAEGVARIDGVDRVLFDVLKCDGIPIHGQSASAAENKALDAFAKTARDYVRSTAALDFADRRRFSLSMEELTFDATDAASAFFADRRTLIKTIDQAVGRTRVKSEPEAGIAGTDETTGDFFIQSRPDGAAVGAEVTIRVGKRVLSMAALNVGLTLADGATVADAGSDNLAEAAALATSAIEALKLGKNGDPLHDAGFGRAVKSAAL